MADSRKPHRPPRADATAPDRPDAPLHEAVPARERRSADRVTDDQKSGQGAMSALSKLKMIERRRAALKPGSD